MTVKLIKLSLLVLLLQSCTQERKHQSFSGKWIAHYEDGYHFNVNLAQKGAQISGDYCAWPQNLERVDCATDSGSSYLCEIHGKTKNDTAYIEFVSCYSGDTGKASLYIDKGVLHWKTTFNPYTYDNPKTGGNSEWNGVPNAATLNRIEVRKK